MRAQEIKKRIERRLGFLPPFFATAFDTPEVLENFWQQTLSAYLDNPLPALFKEKLFACLSRFCSVPYCIVCHSCALRPLGMTGRQVMDLLETPPPLTEADAAWAMTSLSAISSPLQEWLPHSPIEASLLTFSTRVFLAKRQPDLCGSELRRLLGPAMYSHLMAFLAYVKTCHFWIEAHPELSYEEDWRARKYLAGLIDEEPRLAEFFREYSNKVPSFEEHLADEITNLKTSEARFRELLELAPDGMVVVDGNGRIRLVNAQTEKMFGYAREELLGKPVEVLIPRRFGEGHVAHRSGYAASPRVRPMGCGFDLCGRRKNGSEFPVDISVGPMRVGEVILVIASVRDISEKKETERALRESQDQIRLLMNSTAEGIYGIDLHGCCTFINASGLRLLGYSQDDEVLGKNMHALIHHTREDGTAYPAEECRIYEAFRGGLGTYADGEVLWRKDGACFPAEYWSHPIRLGEETMGCVVTFLDITGRKRIEMEEKRLLDIINATPDLVGIADWPYGSPLYINPAGRRMLGIREDEDLRGLKLKDFRSESGWQRVLDEIMPTVYEKGHWNGESVFLTRDGREVPVLQVVIAHRERDGSIEYFSTIARDISEYKRMENQLGQSQKMEAIGRLAGGIAHDFNNLLTVILGHSSLLLDELPPESPVKNDLEQIKKAGDRAALLTRQMLAFSRKQVLQPRVLNLNAVVSNIEGMLHRLIGEDIELVTVLDPKLRNTRVDPGQMEQIIVNLAVNARDAMSTGGMLTVETSNVELDVSFSRKHVDVKPGPYAMMAVSDTGSGIEPEALVQIFEPFFTTKEHGKGTGLGLATVYGIVKQSGGYIWVYSEPGGGTAFKIYLPSVEEPVHAGEAPDTGRMPLAGSETILLVEDEEMVRSLACEVLRKRGYTVLESADCDEALRIAQQYDGAIHLVLTDVVMPQMSGQRLAEEVRLYRESIKILFMSGYTENAVQSRGVLSPGAGFLEKPFSAEGLIRMVRQTLAAPKQLEPEKTATVLVIDDDEEVKKLISALLQQAGYKVVPAADAMDAGRLLEMVAVDLVITDVLLPYKDGIDFAAELRRTFPELKIIAMSGDPQALRYASTAQWFDDVLTKPPSREQLLLAVKAVLRG